MHLFIDLDKNKDKGIIKSDFLDNIREHFSEEDDKAGLKKRLFKNKHIPSRRYVITQQGRFEIGLLFEIINYLKGLNTPFKIVFSEEFKQRYASAYSFANNELIELNLPARPYQIEGVKKGLKSGNGVFLFPTASGKTLLIALLIENIRKNDPNTKTLIVTLTHLIDQFYTDFISYGISPHDISKWSGENEVDTNAKIIICGPNILYNKIENTVLELKKAKIVYLTLKKQLDTDPSLTNTQKLEMQSALTNINKDMNRLLARGIENKKTHEFFETITLLMFDECLRSGTKIKTVMGDKNIEDINVGDYVLSYNIKNNVNEYKKVIKKYKNMIKSNSYDHFLQITLENGKIIETTPNHKIYTINRGYVRADCLSNIDDILFFKGV